LIADVQPLGKSISAAVSFFKYGIEIGWEVKLSDIFVPD